MDKLNFSFNWNNKLDCKAFTSLRLSDRFNIGDCIEITLKHEHLYFANIIGKRSFLLEHVTDYIAYIDTGYDAEKCKNILKRMYKKKKIDWFTQTIYFYLIKRQKDK